MIPNKGHKFEVKAKIMQCREQMNDRLTVQQTKNKKRDDTIKAQWRACCGQRCDTVNEHGSCGSLYSRALTRATKGSSRNFGLNFRSHRSRGSITDNSPQSKEKRKRGKRVCETHRSAAGVCVCSLTMEEERHSITSTY